jgi:hypothetical protein
MESLRLQHASEGQDEQSEADVVISDGDASSRAAHYNGTSISDSASSPSEAASVRSRSLASYSGTVVTFSITATVMSLSAADKAKVGCRQIEWSHDVAGRVEQPLRATGHT